MSDIDTEFDRLSSAIAGLEAQRGLLGDAIVDSAIAALRQQIAQLGNGSDGVETNAEERKLVTILFADVSGFTALSEKLDPEKVRELINACFDWLVPLLQKYDGTIDKFIGDEIMALFGAPVAHEDDAERALRAALEMMDAISAFNAKHGTELGLHLGINTGLVVAGQIGAQNRRDYSVMGDAVNLAARLEDASSIGEVFVGSTTYRLAHHMFDFDPVAPLKVKGKEALIESYRLVGLKAAPKPARGIEGLHSSLVGRDDELTLIHEAVAALNRGSGSVLAIIGDAGLGKSRLLAEARSLLPPKVRWAEGRALSYTAGMSYWLAQDTMMNLLGLSPGAAPNEITNELRLSLDEHGMGDRFPYLASMLGLKLTDADEAEVKSSSAEVLQSRILSAARDYVRAIATKQPLVLVWEDLHWCDPSSLQVLEMQRNLTREVPLLILSAARPAENGQHADLSAGNYASRTIHLAPLTRHESSSLIHELLNIENLPDAMRDLILSRAEGNPFFLEELLRSLIDAGVVVIADGVATAIRGIDSIAIPETVQGVLAARIDRLQSEQKQALQRASVVGRLFQKRVLERLYQESAHMKRRLAEALSQLQEREFILSKEQHVSETAALGTDEYIFKHAITHDVAYSSMLLARRKELHQLTAQAIEALFPDRLDEHSATLGFHYERAENADRAAHYLGRAAGRAKATFANAEAIAFYESAIAALNRVPAGTGHRSVAAKLNEDLGDVLTLTGCHEAARLALERALTFLTAIEVVPRSRMYRKLGFSHSSQRHFEESARAYDRADEELGDDHDASASEWWEEKVQIQMERMHLFYWQGMTAEMRRLADRFRDAIMQRGAPIQRAKFLKTLALSMLMESRFRPSDACKDLAANAVSEAERAADLSEASHIRFVRGLIQVWREDFGDAIEHFNPALEFAERVGDIALQARCLTYRTVAYRRIGDVARTRADAGRTISVASQIGMPEYVAMAKANIAWVEWRNGDIQKSEVAAAEALELWHAMEDPYGFDWMAVWPLVAISFARDDVRGAIDQLKGLFGPHQHPIPDELAEVSRRAIAAAESGDTDGAVAKLRRALEIADKIGHLKR